MLPLHLKENPKMLMTIPLIVFPPVVGCRYLKSNFQKHPSPVQVATSPVYVTVMFTRIFFPSFYLFSFLHNFAASQPLTEANTSAPSEEIRVSLYYFNASPSSGYSRVCNFRRTVQLDAGSVREELIASGKSRRHPINFLPKERKIKILFVNKSITSRPYFDYTLVFTTLSSCQCNRVI